MTLPAHHDCTLGWTDEEAKQLAGMFYYFSATIAAEMLPMIMQCIVAGMS